MKKTFSIISAVLILILIINYSFGQNISDEARRHFNRGLAAVETAKSAADYQIAITEFETAAKLAPNWADAYFNLGVVQEKLGKYDQTIFNLKRYLEVSPGAADANAVKGLIAQAEFKLEVKKKQVEQYRKVSGVWSTSIGPWFSEYAFYSEGGELKMMDSENSTVSFDGQLLRAKWQGKKILYFDPAVFELNARLNADGSMTGILKEISGGSARMFQATMSRNLLRSTYYWIPLDSKNDTVGFAGGRLVIDHKKKGTTFSWRKIAWQNYAPDFALEARMTFASGDESNFYGILWGDLGRIDQPANFHFFGVTSTGNYGYRKLVNGSWVDVAIGPSAAVKKGNASNILTIRKKTDKLEFYVNGTLVNTVPAEKYFGFIGFHVNHFMRVEIDYIRIDYE